MKGACETSRSLKEGHLKKKEEEIASTEAINGNVLGMLEIARKPVCLK